jgi:hypothetical protein
MNNNSFEFPLLRTLNTLLLAGILATQVIILSHIPEPIRVREPIDVEVTRVRGPVDVEVTNEPSVEIANEPLEVLITR